MIRNGVYVMITDSAVLVVELPASAASLEHEAKKIAGSRRCFTSAIKTGNVRDSSNHDISTPYRIGSDIRINDT